MREDLLPTTFDGKLYRVVEEAGEVLQAYGKMKRFGKIATDRKTGKRYDNLQDLRTELRQLHHAIEEFLNHG